MSAWGVIYQDGEHFPSKLPCGQIGLIRRRLILTRRVGYLKLPLSINYTDYRTSQLLMK